MWRAHLKRLLPQAAGLSLAAIAVAAACAMPAGARAATPAPAGISVAGKRLLADGVPWVPRGVQIVGLVAPDAGLSGKYVPAHAHFGAPELAAAVADHADLVRFQVSEFGLNPADPLYDPAYVQEVAQGVALARADGLKVIVSLQAQAPAGSPTRCPLPDAGAATDWSELASLFGADPDVMFELYNEPGVPATPAFWQEWVNGGPVPGAGCTAVGMQSLIDTIRATGAHNVIVVPGLAGETTLRGMPALTDPADPTDPQLAYGIHYPNLTLETTAWDSKFGAAAAHVPVIVTEWQANSTTSCVADAPQAAPLLLAYLALKQIGVVGFAFDLPGTIVADYSYAPTSYAGFACGQPGGGAGQLLFDAYAGEAAQGAGATAAAAAAEATADAAGQPSPVPVVNAAGQAWLLDVGEATRLAALDPSSVDRALDSPRTLVTDTSADQLAALGLGAATAAEEFTDGSALSRAVNSGALRPGTHAVVLELGPTSPVSQQRQAAVTFQIAAQAAHRNGLLFVAAPQLSLLRRREPHVPRRNWPVAFLRSGLVGAAARFADAVVLPFSSIDTQRAGYTALAQVGALQATNARAGVAVLDGLSTAGAVASTGTRLAADVRASSAAADTIAGYSLSGPAGAGDASAVDLLRRLFGHAG